MKTKQSNDFNEDLIRTQDDKIARLEKIIEDLDHEEEKTRHIIDMLASHLNRNQPRKDY